GRFELLDMLPGRVFVEISRGGSVPYRSSALSLSPGQRLELSPVSLRGGVTLTGRVVDESGAPIDGARVVITAAPGGRAGAAADAALGEVVAVTERGGQFATSVLEGMRQLRISAAGLQDQTVMVLVSAAAPPAPVVVRLGGADAAVEGSARDEQGRPV